MEYENIGFCGEDEYGDEERELRMVKAVRKGWANARDAILAYMHYWLCRFCVKTIRSKNLTEQGIDQDSLFSAAQIRLELALDNKKGLPNGPFASHSERQIILRNCWGYIYWSTRSAVRDLGRRKDTKQLSGADEVADYKKGDSGGSAIGLQLMLHIQFLTPKQREVIPVLLGAISQAELARELGISEAAVHKRRTNTIKRLRKLLGVDGRVK